MRILFVTEDFSGASLCMRLAKEGNEVRAHVGKTAYAQTLDGWVEKIASIEAGLEWVGKDGLIVCDDNGFGELQDRLRREGYSVVGGSTGGDLLESDREHAQKVFAAHGLKRIPTRSFESANAAADFVAREQVGVALNSLRELPELIRTMPEEDYQRYAANARRVGAQLRAGENTKRALRKLEEVE